MKQATHSALKGGKTSRWRHKLGIEFNTRCENTFILFTRRVACLRVLIHLWREATFSNFCPPVSWLRECWDEDAKDALSSQKKIEEENPIPKHFHVFLLGPTSFLKPRRTKGVAALYFENQTSKEAFKNLKNRCTACGTPKIFSRSHYSNCFESN